jgi:hypothetical protein
MNWRSFTGAVRHADFTENIVRRCFGVFNNDIEVAVLGKGILERVVKFVLVFLLSTTAILFGKLCVGKSNLRILVEHPHVTVCGRTI